MTTQMWFLGMKRSRRRVKEDQVLNGSLKKILLWGRIKERMIQIRLLENQISDYCAIPIFELIDE